MFGLFGSLFVLTQFLQFQLGFSPLQAGVRMLPAAGAIAVVAPLSSVLVRAFGTRVTIAIGLFIVTAGLWQISSATGSTTYGGVVVGMALLGVGAGLVIPSATASVMGSLPGEHTGVGGGTNGTFLQTGGALGVAVVGSLLSNRYDDQRPRRLPPSARARPNHPGHARLGARRRSTRRRHHWGDHRPLCPHCLHERYAPRPTRRGNCHSRWHPDRAHNHSWQGIYKPTPPPS
jgi:hypothetical protein